MNTLLKLSCIALLATSFSSFAEASSSHLSAASKHSALAASHGVAGSAQVASAVVAVPLIVVGSAASSVGAVSVELGEGLSKVASSKATKVNKRTHVELEVTEITITVDRSPADVMKTNQ